MDDGDDDNGSDNYDLPVAIPVIVQQAQEQNRPQQQQQQLPFRHRRRRGLLAMMRRAGRPAPEMRLQHHHRLNFNRHHPEQQQQNMEQQQEQQQMEDDDDGDVLMAAAASDLEDDDDDDDDEDQIPALGLDPDIMVAETIGDATTAAATAVITSEASPFLYDLIREGLPCSQVLSGAHVKGCSQIVERCRDHAIDVYYQCRRNGRTPLHEAAIRCSCLHVIGAIMDVDGSRSMHTDHMHNTPLHLLFMGMSSRRLDPSNVEELVQKLLEPNPGVVALMCNRDGMTPLHCACSAPEVMVPLVTVQRLLEASGTCASRVNNKNQTPLHLHCHRRNASVEVAQVLIPSFPDAIQALDQNGNTGVVANAINNGGSTPLHYAAANANYELIMLLIRVDPMAATIRTTNSDRTPLHILCNLHPTSPAALPAIQSLVDAAPDVVMRPDQVNGYTPLHLLCRGGPSRVSLPILEALISAYPAALSKPDRNLYLPLHHATEVGADPAVIACLLGENPPSAHALTRKKDCALSLACATNHDPETVRILLEAWPEAVWQANDYGFVPLHCVCRAYQPKAEICRALVEACPQTARRQTHAGELPVHLASSSTGSSVSVIEILTRAYDTLEQGEDLDGKGSCHRARDDSGQVTPAASTLRTLASPRQGADGPVTCASHEKAMTSKVGNTPLHYACFRGFAQENIEALAEEHPEWITVRNNAGYSPLQILCKNCRIDERIITLFSRICGPEIFSNVDLMGNTPLHSAMREETSVEALRALIRAYPEALHMKTTYDDTPLHLACLRRLSPDVVREVALATSQGVLSPTVLVNCNGRLSPLLAQNTAGQTPIAIAMEDFQLICRGIPNMCCVNGDYGSHQSRSFDVLASLVKILHYGPVNEDDTTTDSRRRQSLVRACVALHRKDARLDPAFIRRALHLYPEEAKDVDEHGNTPLHIEASIPVEKMSLLDGSAFGCCGGSCHRRMGVLRMLLDIYPEAAKKRNEAGDLPLGLMVQNGRPWDGAFAMAVRTNPQALNWVKDLTVNLTPRILARVSEECGVDTLNALIRSRPAMVATEIDEAR